MRELEPLFAAAVVVLTAGCGHRPVAAAPATALGPCDSAGAVDILDHSVQLRVSLDPPSLTGEGTVRVRARQPTSTVVLDAVRLEVTRVTDGDERLTFVGDGRRVSVQLERPLAQGAERELRLTWTVPVGAPVPHFERDQVWAGYKTSAWMPTLLDAAQRATLRLRIATRSGLTAVGSGRSIATSPRPDGLTDHDFEVDRPSPPFLFAFAVGDFAEAHQPVGEITLRALGPRGADLTGAIAALAPMIRFFVDHTGAPLPAPTYTAIFVTGDAAQEAAGLAFMSADALEDLRRDPSDDWILSHELAHQWFAWLVPCADFADFWLNEGFATFAVGAYKQQRWGQAAYERELAVWRQRSAKVHAEGRDAPLSLSPPGAPHVAPTEAQLQPRGVTYFRGALALHRLRADLGDEVFWSAVRRYVRGAQGRGANSEDWRRALEAASNRDLGSFFDEWVYAPAPGL